VALYRFLFAPVLLAVAVLTTSPRRAHPPAASPAPVPVQAHGAPGPLLTVPAHAPARVARVGPSHPGSVPVR
jgi:hypothetical protein